MMQIKVNQKNFLCVFYRNDHSLIGKPNQDFNYTKEFVSLPITDSKYDGGGREQISLVEAVSLLDIFACIAYLGSV